MRATVVLIGAASGWALSVNAQNGLRDIPDPDVASQEAAFKLPEGAEINLFASEPMISKPIQMNWDAAGRLWVVGSPMYPHIEPGQPETDKLFVLEDRDGDGVADAATEFADDLHIPTAVLPGDGGVYIANSTEMLFLRDSDGDGKSDERRVVLSGFGTEDTHHLLHTFGWGPEGMLWMNQSIYIHSHVETPYGVRRLLGGGMWHYRPETGRLEVFMKGLVNSWGHVFDEWGQSFMTDGAGGDGINFVFPRSVFMTSPGASRILSGLNPGQPKHCGLEVASGRHVPEDWVGTLLAPDFRGHRINRFKLTDNGSAYTSTQVEDLVSSTHRAFRPIDVKMGPDGAIYIADWYNPIIQHGEVDFRDPRRDHTHGRIWRITFPERELVKPPTIAGAAAEELVKLLDAPEGWTRTQATAELRKREAGEVMPVLDRWWKSLEGGQDLQKLRAIWGSQAVNGFRRDWAEALAQSPNHKARAGALRALYYSAPDEGADRSLVERAVVDAHPQVRLWAVSVLAQLDWPDTVQLAVRALDGEGVDEFLDFAVWSICREHAERWVAVAQERNPFETTRQLFFAARALGQPIGMAHVLESLRAGEFNSDAQLNEVADWIANAGDASHLEVMFGMALAEETTANHRAIMLKGLADAARLRKQRPAGDLERLLGLLGADGDAVFSEAATLAGQWKLEAARGKLEETVRNAEAGARRVEAALAGLQGLGGGKTVAFLREVAGDSAVPFARRVPAVNALTRVDPKAGAEVAVVLLERASEAEQARAIVDSFLVNKEAPGALAEALDRSGTSLRPAIALAGMNRAGSSPLKPEGLVEAFRKAGELKPMKLQLSAAEMEAMMAKVAEEGDPHRGEEVYRRAALQCITCHAIGGVGGVVGPDLVSIGASAPIDYLVESLLEPSKKIKEGYHTAVVTTKSGDSYAGAVAREDEREVVIRDATGKETRIPKAEVASSTISPVSLMPPGLTATLREDEFVDLVRFMAELGKEGEFKTQPNRLVRHWEVLQPHERTRDAIGHYGRKIFAEDIPTYEWTPLVARVDGSLPAAEMPRVEGRGSNRFGVARCFLEADEATTAPLKITGKLKDLELFLGEEKIELPPTGDSATVEVPLKVGRNKLTVTGLLDWGFDEVAVELLGEAGVVRAVDGGR